jgi:hypothetical protein
MNAGIIISRRFDPHRSTSHGKIGRVPVTVWSLLPMGAAVAGLIEEAAFRGYMQRRSSDVTTLRLALLRRGRGDLRHDHIPDKFHMAGDRAAYGRQRLFELRSMAARPRRVLSFIRRDGVGVDDGH